MTSLFRPKIAGTNTQDVAYEWLDLASDFLSERIGLIPFAVGTREIISRLAHFGPESLQNDASSHSEALVIGLETVEQASILVGLAQKPKEQEAFCAQVLVKEKKGKSSFCSAVESAADFMIYDVGQQEPDPLLSDKKAGKLHEGINKHINDLSEPNSDSSPTPVSGFRQVPLQKPGF